MKKRRSTVFVQPGKDVTLYVPVDTPPEVIAYLNELKQEGTFSQGIVEILTEYVHTHLQSRPSFQDPVAYSAGVAETHAPPVREGVPTADHFGLQAGWADPLHSSEAAPLSAAHTVAGVAEPALARPDHPLSAATSEPGQTGGDPVSPATQTKLNLAEIFAQAKKNSGKLLE